ncbi:hypothetical protein MTX78_16570 [Hymenobacter tibetensis]|uniref:Uncharacterized protein n=1 Tax=Hymenobacter tibetensis TaxID=497967 RepID=A0ABY4CUE4_9BACT|nr:hypothetical protein [Hymenobacter tibetensis]UOG73726.1 hypothetical protein MTX78_16570 [Hymenobacter tibetensis]
MAHGLETLAFVGLVAVNETRLYYGSKQVSVGQKNFARACQPLPTAVAVLTRLLS